ncbi:hypothetical protein [Brevibacillus choshinensis]|uniref:Uncharacterized protein n=1 Tax=Brevibacillus choshinensis TaxID=54911 RepID=A0ABX7FHU6_BRECH|nr:hypothetical protein [Brevibacillus choshinensis]QRG65277.1 hypothetical protein JNE38_16690 [Brevibacillus choshinensis]
MWTGDALQWFGIFLSIFLIYYGFRYQFSKAPLEKQLYSAYLPMFRIMEPYLYQNCRSIGKERVKDLLSQLLTIVDKHYELIEPNIIYWCRLLESKIVNPESKSEIDDIFIHLSVLIDREFERTRARLFLPTRDIYYRLNNRHYASKLRMYIDILLISIPQLMALGGVCYLALTLLQFTDNIVGK